MMNSYRSLLYFAFIIAIATAMAGIETRNVEAPVPAVVDLRPPMSICGFTSDNGGSLIKQFSPYISISSCKSSGIDDYPNEERIMIMQQMCSWDGIYCNGMSNVIGMHIYNATKLDSIPASLVSDFPHLVWLRVDSPVRSSSIDKIRSIFGNNDSYNYYNDKAIDASLIMTNSIKERWRRHVCIVDINSRATDPSTCSLKEPPPITTTPTTSPFFFGREYESRGGEFCFANTETVSAEKCEFIISSYFNAKAVATPILLAPPASRSLKTEMEMAAATTGIYLPHFALIFLHFFAESCMLLIIQLCHPTTKQHYLL